MMIFMGDFGQHDSNGRRGLDAFCLYKLETLKLHHFLPVCCHHGHHYITVGTADSIRPCTHVQTGACTDRHCMAVCERGTSRRRAGQEDWGVKGGSMEPSRSWKSSSHMATASALSAAAYTHTHQPKGVTKTDTTTTLHALEQIRPIPSGMV